ncbi:MAG TPA: Shedu anti-phage system protein SduA domain-containing protein [Chthoniobacterales bacterium]|nr:Shedu anti-phage system protein SduA domain-containing protein [Chthoniobacterales bacterium]
MNTNPWPENYVEHRVPSTVNLTDYQAILDAAADERPLQTFFAAVPSFLRQLVPSCANFWCFDRMSFGGELIPDFLLCYRNSRGFNWAYVELESPTVPPLIKAGRASSKLNQALGQISDWRNWLRDNISYAREHHGLKQIDAEAPAFVVIGRRGQVRAEHALKYRALSSDRTSVMTYDRLAEIAVTGLEA